MSTEFHLLSKAVSAQFDKMHSGATPLFQVDVDEIFDKYLAAFPEGTNPIYITNTEHDCSCCKNFVRNIGRVVALQSDGTLTTVWDDLGELPEPYATVALRMRDLVRQQPIVSVYFTKESQYGAATSKQLLESGSVKTWNHFVAKIPSHVYSREPDSARGAVNTVAGVLRRGLEEIDDQTLASIVDLIDSKSIYRGEEHLSAVKAFRELRRRYEASPNRENFIWANANDRSARFRNTVIGTLATDLATGVDLERAVKSFESKVAPANYKRSSALITPKMIEKALSKLRDLGLEGAVERRMARIGDVSVNDVIFVDNSVQGQMKGGLEGLLLEEAKPVGSRAGQAQDISVEDFLANIVPNAKTIDLELENDMLGKFMTITAPVHDDTGRLFKWDNDFAWTYDGDVTDSITVRVKNAGGNVNAALRVSLAWSNTDDLDIHASAPEGRINYMDKKGILDVDMNIHGESTTPVENLSWVSPRDGHYSITVNNFTRRGSENTGYTLELASPDGIEQFSAEKNPSNGATHKGISFDVKAGRVLNLSVDGKLTGGSVPTTKWGVTTGQLVRVNTLVASPNHWGDNASGNRHWFFILAGCKNPDEARGIYNEYLRSDLNEHRKVFEVLGAKTKAPSSDDQLSGVGFSSTRNDSAVVVIDGRKAFKVQF